MTEIERPATVGRRGLEELHRRHAPHFGEGAELLRGARDLAHPGRHQRLAGVRHLGGDEIVEPRQNAVRDLVQQCRARLDAELARLPADHLLAFIDVLTQARNVLRVNANRPMLVDRLAWQFANLAGHCPTAI